MPGTPDNRCLFIFSLMVYSLKNSSPMATKGRIAEEYTKYKIHTNLYKVKKQQNKHYNKNGNNLLNRKIN